MTIDNTHDVIDSREIIERIDELEAQVADGLDAEEAEELAALQALAKEGADYCADWEYGETLIRDDYFVDYITDLISECYEMPKEMNSGAWPYRHMTMDYEAAAEEAKADYSSFDYRGVTYWGR